VAPHLPRPGHGLLRCPVCRLDLTAASGALSCHNRHSFDLAREGYVNLLLGSYRRPAAGGDSSEQLRHRALFLEAVYFDAIATTIVSRLPPAGSMRSGWRVLDAGFGTGHHLAGIAAALKAPMIGLGLDIARGAARRAARRWPELAFAVADLWAEWPVRDKAADLVISIFAPKNFAEAARVLRPGGWLAVAYPGADHLAELNRRFGLMQQHPHKMRDYMEAAGRLVGPCIVARLFRRSVLDGAAIRDAVLMGPNARHIAPAALNGEAGQLSVTFDVSILLARKRR